MILDDTGEELRKVFMDSLHLSKINEQLAQEYLDMDREEAPELLDKAEPQDFSTVKYRAVERVYYLDWLYLKKRKEELGRYVRFGVKIGGATAWNYLLKDNYFVRTAHLDKLLVFLTGQDAKELKIALKAGLLGSMLTSANPADVKALCEAGKENPEIFLRAMEYCRSLYVSGAERTRDNARMLLTAMYLHHMPSGAAPELTGYLEEHLTAAMEDSMPFELIHEVGQLRSFAKTAGRDTPFPQRIMNIYGKSRQRCCPVFFTACVFLAIRHSLRFEILLRLVTAAEYRYVDRKIVLETCRGIVEEDWFEARMEELEDMLPIEDDDYILWSLKNDCRGVVERMALKSPEGVKAAAEKTESELYEKLMEIVRSANPVFYEEMKSSYRDMLRRKMASELMLRCYSGKAEAQKYLLEEASVEILASCVEEWEYMGYAFSVDEEEPRYRKIDSLRKRGEISMYRRAVVLELLHKEREYFEWYKVDTSREMPEQIPEEESRHAEGFQGSLLGDKSQLESICMLLEEEEIPLWMRADALGGICASIKDKKKKADRTELCVEVFAEGLRGQEEQWEEQLREAVSKTASACVFILKVLEKIDGGRYRDVFLSCAVNSAKQVRELLLEVCGKHDEWEPEILTLLCSKKQREREFAVLVLGEWCRPSCLAAVRAALAAEKNKKLTALLQELEADLERAQAEGESVLSGRKEEKLAADILKGARKKKVEWVRSLSLPEVHRQDGEIVSQEYLLSILAVYADMDVPGIQPDAEKLAAPLEQKGLSGYMRSLYEGWLSMGAEAKKRWVLYAVSIHGGPAIVPVFCQQIKDWAEHSRGAMAAETVQALALNGSPEALVQVDQMSRKFKFRQIKNAAGEALSNAASALGISREVLEDRIVPNLGLNAQMERVFDYGSRSFTVRLSPALEIEVYDGNGKQLKNLPSPGKQDDPEKAGQASEEFKQMKKQLKTVVQNQKLRLEQALSAARFWKARDWKKLFVENPMMHRFAAGLIWGVYRDGALKETFRYMEDGSFNTVDEKEYGFPEDTYSNHSVGNGGAAESGRSDSPLVEEHMIGLVHPLELSQEELSAWKNQLEDYEIIQPFDQLNRPVYRMTEEEKDETVLARFHDKIVNGLSLSGKLLGAGWFRGQILDAGFFENYYRNDGTMGAELTFSGSSVGCENEEVTIYDLCFYRLPDRNSETAISNVFSKGNRCRLKEVSPRYFSEIVRQIAKAVE